MEDLNYQAALFSTEQQQITSDDYYTPKWLFDALGLRFALDVASPPQGPPYVPCDKFYTLADDGLAQPWDGLVWMNPPYSKPKPWVAKFLRHNNGLALLPNTRSQWYWEMWNSDATVVSFNLAFERPGQDKPVGAGVFPTSVWALGDTAKEALVKANFGKVR